MLDSPPLLLPFLREPADDHRDFSRLSDALQLVTWPGGAAVAVYGAGRVAARLGN